MRHLLGLVLSLACFAQAQGPRYVFGFLRAHPERMQIPQAQAEEIQKHHMAHLGKMAKDGILIAAGPLENSKDLRGVIIFQGISVEEARKRASEDPAVINKRLVVDVAPWPGPPGIGEANAAKLKADPNHPFKMTKHTLSVYWRTEKTPDFASPEAKEGLNGHMAFVREIQKNPETLALGPLIGSKDFIGIAIYKTPDVEAALKRSESDPFRTLGWARAEAFIWWTAENTMPERPAQPADTQ